VRQLTQCRCGCLDPKYDGKFRAHFEAALLDPHYVALIAAMPDAQDILGTPHATYVGPAGIHWELTDPPTSLLDSPCATLPWQVYEHSYVAW
jgi:hypothetical protein